MTYYFYYGAIVYQLYKCDAREWSPIFILYAAVFTSGCMCLFLVDWAQFVINALIWQVTHAAFLYTLMIPMLFVIFMWFIVNASVYAYAIHWLVSYFYTHLATYVAIKITRENTQRVHWREHRTWIWGRLNSVRPVSLEALGVSHRIAMWAVIFWCFKDIEIYDDIAISLLYAVFTDTVPFTPILAQAYLFSYLVRGQMRYWSRWNTQNISETSYINCAWAGYRNYDRFAYRNYYFQYVMPWYFFQVSGWCKIYELMPPHDSWIVEVNDRELNNFWANDFYGTHGYMLHSIPFMFKYIIQTTPQTYATEGDLFPIMDTEP